jgi:hypothetical protein
MAETEHLTELRKARIKRRMERTRAALAAKLQQLGDKFHGAAETVGAVQETVESTVETVQNVRDTLDVRKNPLMVLGGSVVAGYLAGLWLHRRAPAQPAVAPAPAPAPAAAPAPEARDSTPGLLASLLERGKRLGLGTVLGLVRDLVVKEAPPEARPTVMDFANGVITRFGGEPPGPLLVDPEGEDRDGRHDEEMAGPLGPVERQGQTTLGPAYRR